MNRKLLLKILGLFIVLIACNRYIAPPFTDVDKISRLNEGMKLKQIVDILGIEPYNVYHMQNDGVKLLTFNYRLKNRKLKVPTLNRDEFARKTTNEQSQTAGEVYYDKDYKTLYVMMFDEELTSLATTTGLEDSEFILVHQNNIRVIQKEEVTQYENLRDSIPNVEIYRIIRDNKRILPRTEGKSFIKRIF